MTSRSISRAARLVGVVVWPLVTAPAAGADWLGEFRALLVRAEAAAVPRTPRPGSTLARDVRRVSF